MRQSVKTIIVLLLLVGLFYLINDSIRASAVKVEIDFSEFIANALPEPDENGVEQPTKVKNLVVKGELLEGELLDGKAFKTRGDIKEYQKDLISRKINVKYVDADGGVLVAILTSWLPMLFFIFIFFFFMRQANSGGGRLFSFGKSKHRVLSEEAKKVTFQDVAGIEEAKVELGEIVGFLQDPKRYTRLGGRIPKGVLLMGPPGTGKTLLARAVAGEAGVPFFSISGSDFVEMFVGVGASRVRDLFEQGKKRAPCIIFIDEIDAVGRQRGAGLGGGHDEREQTLNQLLVEMDGFESNSGVIILAATNRPDVLDPALLRAGRFDRRVVVPGPDNKGREAILEVHTKKVPLADDVDLETIAKGTPGFVGADLANIVNEAALLAARKNHDKVTMADFEEAKDKVIMGAARKSIVMSEDERELTAYHEAGHAIVAWALPGTDPLHKVTIVPRGMSLGLTMQLPTEDRYTVARKYLEKRLAIMMGGRAAELLIFEEETSGAGQDIKVATETARRMVAQWGMSKLGPIHMDQTQDMVFLGKEIATQREVSESTAQKVDAEIASLVLGASDQAFAILKAREKALHGLAIALLERETLDGNEIDEVLRSNGAVPEPEDAIRKVVGLERVRGQGQGQGQGQEQGQVQEQG
ncbi:MAG TPA: ATP-dependent zinc metalloprotease FtsH [Myxococcota bacterium]|nr:ATP-dependent zinc metalloprotease FtsH [Myxococcota bacterium]